GEPHECYLFAGCVLDPFSSLLRRFLDAFHGLFGIDFGPVADILDSRLRCMSYFLSGMLGEMSSLGCALVHIVSNILRKRHSYAENRQRWNSCNSKCFHLFSFSNP